MQTPTHDNRAAMALATASVIGDKRAAERHHCAVRTLQDWRKRCETDETLAAACALKRAELVDAWVDEIPAALTAAIDFLHRAALEADHTDPNVIHAIAGAMKLLSDTTALQRALDVRCPRTPRQDASGPGPVVSEALN